MADNKQQIIAGRYYLQQELGRGGMGVVFRAHDQEQDETVAVKWLRPQQITDDHKAIERFNREAEALRRLNHANIVQVVDYIADDENQFLVLEYVSGGDLRARINQGQMPLEQVISITLEIVDALTRAHNLGIVHRDLKPENILLDAKGVPHLTDFGVAFLANKKRITSNNIGVGTIEYMAPESMDNSEIDSRLDIWALGVVMFEMLTGQQPFSGDSPTQTLLRIVRDPLPDLQNFRADLPLDLVDLVERMVHKNARARIPRVLDVGQEILRMIDHGVLQLATPPPFDSIAELTAHTYRQSRNNLPLMVNQFVGREREIERINDYLETRIYLTFSGADRHEIPELIPAIEGADKFIKIMNPNLDIRSKSVEETLWQMEACDVGIYLLSLHSLKSERCQMEIEQLHRMNIPILGIELQKSLDLTQTSDTVRAILDEITIMPFEQLSPQNLLRAQLNRFLHLYPTRNSIISLVAPAGFGRTRLALEIAHHQADLFRHGAFYISLAQAESEDDLPLLVAEAIAYPIVHARGEHLTQLLQFLEDRALLLVLDDIESVPGADAFIKRILEWTTFVVILRIAGQPLGDASEQVVELEAFSTAEALQVLIQSRKSVSPLLTIQADDEADLRALCQLVQGVPFALHILAGLSIHHKPDEIRAPLQQYLKQTQPASEHERCINAILLTMWDLLPAAHHNALTQLAQFGGTFTRDAALALPAVTLDTLRILQRYLLLDRNPRDGHFFMSPLLRQFLLT